MTVLFDGQASSYDADVELGDMPKAHQNFAQTLLETYLRIKNDGKEPDKLEPVTDNLKILDVGAGTGLTTLSVRPHFPLAHNHGIDLSPGMLQKARLKNAFDIARVGDIEQSIPPVPSNRFDITMSTFTFEYIRHWDRAIRNMAQALKPGGLYAASHFFYDDDEPYMNVFINLDGSIDLPPEAIENPYQQFYPIKKMLLAAFQRNKLQLLPIPIISRSPIEIALNPLQPAKQLFFLQKDI